MKLQECIDILGKTINDPKVCDFLEKYGYQYPKKDVITNKTTDLSRWIEHKEANPHFVYSIDINNPLYPLVQAGRKGSFYPRITRVDIYNNFVEGLPLSIESSFEQIVEKYGNPTTKSSDVSRIWKEGEESWYDWEIPYDKEKQLDLYLRYDARESRFKSLMNNKLGAVTIKIHENERLINFYYALDYEDYDDYIKNLKGYDIANRMFIRWLIENGYIDTQYDAKTYIKSLNRGYLGIDDICKDKYVIRCYVFNLSNSNHYLTADIETIFTDEELDSDTMEDSEENYQRIKVIWDEVFNK